VVSSILHSILLFFSVEKKSLPIQSSEERRKIKEFHKDLTEKLSQYLQHSTSATSRGKRSRNGEIISPSNSIFKNSKRSSVVFDSSRVKTLLTFDRESSSDNSRYFKESHKSKKNQTFDETSGWKGEVSIDSILDSNNQHSFQNIIHEYHNIDDHGLIFEGTDSSGASYNSEKRRLEFLRMKLKPTPRWADDRFIKSVSRLQNTYIKNN
jgi:hypothetical protein